MTTASLLLAGLCLCGAAGVLALVSRSRLPYAGLGLAAATFAACGVRADLGDTGFLTLPAGVGFGASRLSADPLAGLFLTLTGVIALPVVAGFAAWARRRADVPFRPLGAYLALTLAGVVVVVTADDAFVFLFGWESVSVAFFLLAGYRRDLPETPGAGMLTYAFSKTSGSFLLVAMLLLAAQSGSFRFASWTAVGGAAHDAAYALALVGFTAKVGVVPLQVWLPAGYAAAPGPARALMSAVAANIGFYGMWRTLAVLGRPPLWLVVVVLAAAGFTALLGIAHAAVQQDLQRVVAYSSVENGGLITVGYGVALAGSFARLTPLIALGVLASALQMVAHAFAKSGLFLASARFEQATGERDLDLLRGAERTEPLARATFSVASLTLAGMPLTLGFVSEWFLLEAIMQLFRVPQLTLELSIAVAGAAVALAAGYAGFTFVRLVGLTALGRGGAAARRRDDVAPLGVDGALALVLPIVGCVGLAALSPWEIRFLAHGLGPLVPPGVTRGALSAAWVLQPVYGRFSALSPSWLAVELPLLAAVTLAFGVVASHGSLLRVRRVPPWRSGAGDVPDAQYTAFAFANPTRHVLGNLLQTRAGPVELAAAPAAQARDAFAGPDPPGPPADLPGPAAALHAAYETDVVEVVEAFLYRPALPPLRGLVAAAKRLQSGRLDAYIAYMLMALVALLAVVVALR